MFMLVLRSSSSFNPRSPREGRAMPFLLDKCEALLKFQSALSP